MNVKSFLIQIIHMLIFGTFLLYVGLATRSSPTWVYNVLFMLGVIVAIVFLVEIHKKTLFWVLWHVLVVATVLIWVGIMKNNSFDFLYKLLIIIGSAAIGYHAIRLVQSLVTYKMMG